MEKALSLVDTSIGKKAVVAVTGAILFGFVVLHLTGNLLLFFGREAIDDYGALLHAIPEALWAARAVLLVSLVTHIVLSVDIARRASAARRTQYRMFREAAPMSPIQTFARQTMLMSGPIIALYVVFHLAHLTGGASVVPGYEFQFGHVYDNVVHGFRVWWITAIYITANALVALHLFHGAQALFQSLGISHPRWRPRIERASIALAAFVGLGNVAIPLLVLARVVGSDV